MLCFSYFQPYLVASFFLIRTFWTFWRPFRNSGRGSLFRYIWLPTWLSFWRSRSGPGDSHWRLDILLLQLVYFIIENWQYFLNISKTIEFGKIHRSDIVILWMLDGCWMLPKVELAWVVRSHVQNLWWICQKWHPA